MEKFVRKFFEEITFFGGIGFYLFLIILFFALEKVDYSIKLLAGCLMIYFFTFLIRLFYFKQRPRKEHYKNFLEKLDASSFPSVHAARAVFLFLVLISFGTIYLKFLLFFVLVLVIVSRIYLKKHYLIDILGGVVLGIFLFGVFELVSKFI